MIRQYFANRKIKKFLKTFSIALPQRYGAQKFFTEGQVQTTLKELGFSADYAELAIALFCDPENYESSGLQELYRKKYSGYREILSAGDASAFIGGDAGGGD